MRCVIPKLLAVVIMTGVAAIPALSADPTLDEIVQKNIDARGGIAKFKALHSLKMTGKSTIGGGQAETVMQMKRPGKVRVDMTVNDQKLVQVVDGDSSWTINPFMGSSEVQPMPDGGADLREAADFEGPLYNYKEKGSKLELQGKEDVSGKPAYKVKLTRKDGRSDEIYIDASTFLDVKRASTRNMMGQEMQIETLVSDYKDVGGIKYAYSVEQVVNGNPVFQLALDSVEPNAAVDDSVFAQPEKK